MTTQQRCIVYLGNVIPHADSQASEKILGLWQSASELFMEFEFSCSLPGGGQNFKGSMQCKLDGVVEQMTKAIKASGSFDAYRESRSQNPDIPVSAMIEFFISSSDQNLDIGEVFHVASVCQQQLFLAMNLAMPGSCQLLGAEFQGEQSHLYEAQSFDAKPFYNARMSAQEKAWPNVSSPTLDACWEWMTQQGFSQSDIAIKDINKALYNMLKLAQQRHRYGSRSALLATQQIQLLLDAAHSTGAAILRNRTRLVLGDIPEAADCFVELINVRNDLIDGNHPVRRPALISHTSVEEAREQIATHNTTLELASALIVALMQGLIESGKDKYEFEEILK